ncbi:MAG: hypothetical protein KW806_02250 [Candidatus Yanofskybacteria bacterium]|nr:hypothetical protein [Candidatus Yanofskybacteria bacterium]
MKRMVVVDGPSFFLGVIAAVCAENIPRQKRLSPEKGNQLLLQVSVAQFSERYQKPKRQTARAPKAAKHRRSHK